MSEPTAAQMVDLQAAFNAACKSGHDYGCRAAEFDANARQFNFEAAAKHEYDAKLLAEELMEIDILEKGTREDSFFREQVREMLVNCKWLQEHRDVYTTLVDQVLQLAEQVATLQSQVAMKDEAIAELRAENERLKRKLNDRESQDEFERRML